MLSGLLVLLAASHAATPEEWAGLYSGRLAAALDHEPSQAITIYEAILDNLSPTDPLRGELLYWLGRAHYAAGDLDAARAALLGAAAAPPGPANPREMADMMQTWGSRVRALPAQMTPDARVSAGSVWRLAFDVLPEPVDEITLRMRAEGGPAIVRIDLMTLNGRRLPSLETIELPAGAWKELTLEMSDFRSVQGADEAPLWLVSLQQHEESTQPGVSIRVAEVSIR